MRAMVYFLLGASLAITLAFWLDKLDGGDQLQLTNHDLRSFEVAGASSEGVVRTWEGK